MTLATHYLDKYEVTVGRYRQFVNAYASGWRPAVGSGANPNISGSGWLAGWDDSGTASSNSSSNLPLAGADTATTLANFAARLKCASNDSTWTDAAGANEAAAINCSNWFESFAFCIWDGGRLPTEAEWEYAAAGGSENRVYPWGNHAPDKTIANYYNMSGKGDPALAVGSYSKGQGRWGHLDLAGGMYEWNLDWSDAYDPSGAAVSNPANLTMTIRTTRSVRGAAWDGVPSDIRAAARSMSGAPANHSGGQIVGLRCARTAP